MPLKELILQQLKLNNGSMDYQAIYFNIKHCGCTNKLYNIALKQLERDNIIKWEFNEIILL